MCEKVSYDTRDLAVKAINIISKNKKQPFRSYNCNECGKWHITSVKTDRLKKPKKNKKGNRYFTPEDLKNLQIIYHLVKEKGYTLDGARIALATNSKISETITMIDRLEFVKAELQKLKDSLVDKPE